MRKSDRVRKGDIIRVRAKLMSGWMGLAVALEDQIGDGIRFRKLSLPATYFGNGCDACRHEVEIVRWARDLRRGA